MENKSFEEMKQTNQVLRAQLTKKNEQYLFQLDRALKEKGLSEEEREELYGEPLQTMVNNQKNGVTARQLFGTVSQYTQLILQTKEQPKVVSSDRLVWLEGSLFMGGIIALMAGFMGMQQTQSQNGTVGVITLILNFIIGGGMLLLMKKNAPDFDKPKGQRGYWKYFGISILATFVWLLIVMFSQVLLPSSVNVVLHPYIYIAIAAGSFALRWYLKKKYNITSAFF